MIKSTYEQDYEEVNNTIDDSRNNQDQVTVGAMTRLCEVPETVYWRALHCLILVLSPV